MRRTGWGSDAGKPNGVQRYKVRFETGHCDRRPRVEFVGCSGPSRLRYSWSVNCATDPHGHIGIRFLSLEV